ncbi:hypothetical protein [Verminephrobacter aporrectodeae]|uniref:hypothetical protein n=1 Tax=Verminephrobacter aporrectodeae TaxID=1110389 RepID=UPI0022448C58|nr:hypothetical protein [Verminephrobacter aporrectodeae]
MNDAKGRNQRIPPFHFLSQGALGPHFSWALVFAELVKPLSPEERKMNEAFAARSLPPPQTRHNKG